MARRIRPYVEAGVRVAIVTVLTAAVLVAAVGSVVTVVIIGEAETKPVWEGTLNTEQ